MRNYTRAQETINTRTATKLAGITTEEQMVSQLNSYAKKEVSLAQKGLLDSAGRYRTLRLIVQGYLTELVRTRPFSLILLDEIEKAHQNILLTFLQVLDDGRLTDSSGVTMDFTNSIIIATSNVGTKEIQEVFTNGGNFEEMREKALLKVREKFAPEFLNRFNDIIVYHPLNRESIEKIAKLLLEDVKRMAKEKGIIVTFKPELINEIVKRGFSPEWGARPLAREIENTVENYLATKILKNEIKSGEIIDLGLEIYQTGG